MDFAIIAGNADPGERLHVRQRLPLWAEIAGSVEKHRRGAVTGQPGVDRLAPGRIDVEGIQKHVQLVVGQAGIGHIVHETEVPRRAGLRQGDHLVQIQGGVGHGGPHPVETVRIDEHTDLGGEGLPPRQAFRRNPLALPQCGKDLRIGEPAAAHVEPAHGSPLGERLGELPPEHAERFVHIFRAAVACTRIGQMRAVIRFIEPQLATEAEGIGGRHESAGFARLAVPVVGWAHQEIDVGGVEHAAGGQMARILLIDPVRSEVPVVSAYEGLSLGRFAHDASDVEQGVGVHVGDEFVEVDRLAFRLRIAKDSRSARPPLLPGGHLGGSQRHLGIAPCGLKVGIGPVSFGDKIAERPQGRLAVVVARLLPGAPHLPFGRVAVVEHVAQDAVGIGSPPKIGNQPAKILADLAAPELRGERRPPFAPIGKLAHLVGMRLLPPSRAGHADMREEMGLGVGIEDGREIAVELTVVVAIGGHMAQVAVVRRTDPVGIEMDSGLGHLAVIAGVLAQVSHVGVSCQRFAVDKDCRIASQAAKLGHGRLDLSDAIAFDLNRGGCGSSLRPEIQLIAAHFDGRRTGIPIGGDRQSTANLHLGPVKHDRLFNHAQKGIAPPQTQIERGRLHLWGRRDIERRHRLNRRAGLGSGRHAKRGQPGRAEWLNSDAFLKIGAGRFQSHVVDCDPALGLVARIDPQRAHAAARSAPLARLGAGGRFTPAILVEVHAVGGPALGNRQLAAEAPPLVGTLIVDVEQIGLLGRVQPHRQPRVLPGVDSIGGHAQRHVWIPGRLARDVRMGHLARHQVVRPGNLALVIEVPDNRFRRDRQAG